MSFWRQLLDSVKDVAPSLAGVAGTMVSGGNPAAGAALAALARKITGGSPHDDLDDLAEAILGNSDQLIQFRLEARRLELEELKLRTLDTQDARKAVEKSRGAIYVSALVSAAFAAAVLMVLFVSVPEGSQAVAYLLLGTLAAAFAQVLNFWLGSSVGSKEKDAILSRYVDAAKTDAAARKGMR